MASIDRVARKLNRMDRAIKTLATAPQLTAASFSDAGLVQTTLVDSGMVDAAGQPIMIEQPVARFGQQPDGSNTSVSLTGPVPPRPVGFTVSPLPGAISVEWFGEFEDRIEPYSDHDFVAVHVSSVANFTPNASTLVASIRARQGERVTIAVGTGTWYVTLVAVSQSGRWSQPAVYSTGAAGEATGIDVTARQMATDAQNAAAGAHQLAAEASADANAAQLVAVNAQTDATAALTAANGKSKLWYSTVAPVAGDGTNGDTWWQRETGTGKVVAVFEKRNGVWENRTLRSEVIDSISAGKITTGTLSAGVQINVGDPAGPHTEIGGTSVITYRLNPEGELTPATILGGGTADSIQIVDPTDGSTLAGFQSDGSGTARVFDTAMLYVNGWQLGDMYDPNDILWKIPRGAVGSFQMTSSAPAVTGADNLLGVMEVSAPIQSGRMYRVRYSGTLLWSGQATGGLIRLQFTDTFDGTAPSITPQSGRTQRMYVNDWLGIDRSKQASLEAYFTPDITAEQPEGSWFTYRCLLSVGCAYTTNPANYIQAFGSALMPMTLTVEDIGPMGAEFMKGGQPSRGNGKTTPTGTPTPPPVTEVKTQTKVYSASWSQTYNSAGAQRTDTNDIVQGYNSYHGIQKAMIGFPSQMQSDLAGATISKIEAYLYFFHWYNGSGGSAVFGVHDQLNKPSTFSYSGSYTYNGWPRDAYRWVTLPSSWYPAFASGVNKGFTLGGGLASNSMLWYGRAWNWSHSTLRPKLRITYTK